MLLNTLYVTAEGASLHKDHLAAVVRVGDAERMRMPLLHLQGIVCFGPVWVSPELMAAIAERGGHVSFVHPSGRFLARAEGVPGGNVLLRRAQYRAADDPTRTLEFARSFVLGKIHNQRELLLHAARDSDGSRREALQDTADQLRPRLSEAERANGLDSIRGIEGIAARDYFSALPQLVRRNGDAFAFEGRSRRPPRDRINAMLSFGYALLLQDCAAACAGAGMDPAVGYLHEDRPGRLGLALDLMEELRAPVVDRLVLALVNRGQIGPDDVMQDESEGWQLTKAGRRTFIAAYQESRAVEIQHAFLARQVEWGKVPSIQAMLVARTLRNDLDRYPPFIVR